MHESSFDHSAFIPWITRNGWRLKAGRQPAWHTGTFWWWPLRGHLPIPYRHRNFLFLGSVYTWKPQFLPLTWTVKFSFFAMSSNFEWRAYDILTYADLPRWRKALLTISPLLSVSPLAGLSLSVRAKLYPSFYSVPQFSFLPLAKG